MDQVEPSLEKDHPKQIRMVKTKVTLDELKALHIPAFEQGCNIFRVNSDHGTVMYYPQSSKWQHRGKTYQGTVQEFRDWLKKHHMLN